SKTGKPFCDTKANGKERGRIGFEATKFEQGGDSHVHAGQNKAKKGIARSKDNIEVGTGKVDKGLKHLAMFTVQIPEYLIKLCSNESDISLDPFMGSGTTAIACMNTNRNYIGFELDENYYKVSLERIEKHKEENKD